LARDTTVSFETDRIILTGEKKIELANIKINYETEMCQLKKE